MRIVTESNKNKKELDAISQNYRETLQDIGVTNGEVLKTIFPNVEISPNPYTPSVDLFVGDILMMRVYRYWWNAPYKAESEDKE